MSEPDDPKEPVSGFGSLRTKDGQTINYFVDSEGGMTIGDTKVEQLPDGTWKATAPIGSIFGAEVEGECVGTGATRKEALEALLKDRKDLNDSLWA